MMLIKSINYFENAIILCQIRQNNAKARPLFSNLPGPIQRLSLVRNSNGRISFDSGHHYLHGPLLQHGPKNSEKVNHHFNSLTGQLNGSIQSHLQNWTPTRHHVWNLDHRNITQLGTKTFWCYVAGAALWTWNWFISGKLSYIGSLYNWAL